MSWLSRLRERWQAKSSSLEIFRDLYGLAPVKSGVTVNLTSALQVATVLACARVIAEDCARLPLNLYRQNGRARGQPVTDHRLQHVLRARANAFQDALQFREQLLMHTVMTGNGYAVPVRVRGEVDELIPLEPYWVKPRQRSDWSVEYEVTIPGRDGAAGRRYIASQAEMFHLRAPSWCSYLGLDAVRQGREAIGLAQATEEHGARFFGQGAHISGVLQTEQRIADKAVIDRLKADFAERYQGLGNTGQPPILSQGLKWQAVQMQNDQAQYLDTRRFQTEELCRLFRVFPIMVMQADKAATYASAEQMFLAHAVYTITPWAERLEYALNAQLLTDDERSSGLYAKHSVQALMRGDSRSRAEFYAKAIAAGWMTRNEARALEDLDPIDGLDLPLRPLNMGDGTKEPAPESADSATPPPTDE